MMGRVENRVFRQRNKMIYSVNCPLDDEEEEEDYSKKMFQYKLEEPE